MTYQVLLSEKNFKKSTKNPVLKNVVMCTFICALGLRAHLNSLILHIKIYCNLLINSYILRIILLQFIALYIFSIGLIFNNMFKVVFVLLT